MNHPTFEDFSPQGEEILMLQKLIRAGKMVHALLITGESGTGKSTLARLLAAAILCKSMEICPCGQCNTCVRVFSSEHPDMVVVEKGVPLSAENKKNRSSIPVDDIREVIRICSVYPLEGESRIVLILNAEDMTQQAQNCLLKTLEEPPANTYFILTSASPEQLLVTVKSRCRILKMKPWPEDEIVRILKRESIDAKKAAMAAGSCHGSIGYAKKLAGDDNYWKMKEDIVSSFFKIGERSQIPAVSSQWKDNKAEMEKLFETLEEYVRVMLRFRLGEKNDARMKDLSEKWQDFASCADLDRFVFLFARISEARKHHEFNVSSQVIVEQLLLSFMGEV